MGCGFESRVLRFDENASKNLRLFEAFFSPLGIKRGVQLAVVFFQSTTNACHASRPLQWLGNAKRRSVAKFNLTSGNRAHKGKQPSCKSVFFSGRITGMLDLARQHIVLAYESWPMSPASLLL